MTSASRNSSPQCLWMVWVTVEGKASFRWGVYGDKGLAMGARLEARDAHAGASVCLIRYDREDKPGVKKNGGKGFR